MTRPSQVWRSKLPRFLKEGVAGAAEALANLDGTYDQPLTVKRLVEHVYYDGKYLSERTVQYQLRMLEAVGILVVRDPAEVISRGHEREYRFNALAVATVDPAADVFRHQKRKKGATEGCNGRVQQKGATDLQTAREKGAIKGATKGATEGCNSDSSLSSCTDLTYIRTSAPPLRVGPVENVNHEEGKTDAAIDGPGEGESPLPPWEVFNREMALMRNPDVQEVFNRAVQSETRNPDVCADGGDHPDAGRVPGLRSDHPTPPGAGVPLRQGPDLPGTRCADPRPDEPRLAQATLGPMDVSAPGPSFTEAIAALRAKFAAPRASDVKTRRQRFG
jgi:hypothetical protein